MAGVVLGIATGDVLGAVLGLLPGTEGVPESGSGTGAVLEWGVGSNSDV